MEEWIKPVMRTIRHIKRLLEAKVACDISAKSKRLTQQWNICEQTDNHQSIRGPKRKMTAEEIKSGKPTKKTTRPSR